jgi:ATP-dependent Clp protease ATP-binding subunit ClpA
MELQLTTKAQEAFSDAVRSAAAAGNPHVEPAHLLEALARQTDTTTPALLEALVAAVPDDWLAPDPVIGDADAQRRAYVAYLSRRLEGPRPFVAPADELRRVAAA